MSNLAHRQQKIQEKRKQTPWREFVMEICSWHSFDFYRNTWKVSRYPKTWREWILIDTSEQYNLNILWKEYTGNFFSDYMKLWLHTPKWYLLKFFWDENCEFADAVFGAKNGYLSFEIWFDATNILYSFLIFSNAHDVVSSMVSWDNSNVLFQSLSISNSSKVFYSRDINNSTNIWFSNNLVGCEECLFCSGLQNDMYCIKNKRLDKEVYFLEKNKYLSDKSQYRRWYVEQSIDLNNVKFSNDIEKWYWSKYIQTWNNIIYAVWWEQWSQNMYDSIDVWINSSNFYAVSAEVTTLIIFTHQVKSILVVIYIIHIIWITARFASVVSVSKINPTASWINNIAKKNDMRRWMQYLHKWMQMEHWVNSFQRRWILSISTIPQPTLSIRVLRKKK